MILKLLVILGQEGGVEYKQVSVNIKMINYKIKPKPRGEEG